MTGKWGGAIGSHLLDGAVRLSVDLGFGGRIGLHSLERSEGFYRRLGLTAVEVERHDRHARGLWYFELTRPGRGRLAAGEKHDGTDMSDSTSIRRDDAWVLEMAAAEEGESIEVGGLYGRLAAADRDASRASLARFVQLARREIGLTPAELAAKAQVTLADLLAIETGRGVIAGPEPVRRVAAVLGVNAERVLVLAGLSFATDSELDAAAAQFAARLEPVAPLDPREREALDWFKSQALMPRPQPAKAG